MVSGPTCVSTTNSAQFLRRAGDTTDGANQHQMRELFRRMVFNILIDNTDDHEKNHALLWQPGTRAGRFSLAPAYDVLPTNSGQGHQEFTVGTEGRDSTLANAMSQCALFGLDNPAATQEVLGVIAVVDTWQQHFAACGVGARDIASLSEWIDGDELLRQRRGFAAQGYGKPAPNGGAIRLLETAGARWPHRLGHAQLLNRTLQV